MADFLEVTKDELVLFESGYKTQPDFLPMKAPRTSKHVAARILQESMYSTFLERWIHIFGCQRILVLDFQLVTQVHPHFNLSDAADETHRIHS